MRKIVLFIMLLLAAFSQSFAQVYPVQVTPQLSPPYSLIISDYYSGTATGAEKLRVMLLNRDLQRTSLEVRLRLTIESQSLRIRTREDVVLPAFTLQSGTPYYVAPSDMAAYFNAANLEFSGISREQYEETGKLPEGFYTFSIEAVETVQGKTVSNKGTAFAWMTLSDPPFLNMPAKGESLTPRTPQNIIFQWTPRQMAAPNAGYSTDYVFSLVEIADPALTPEAAFTTYAPLFTDSVHTTTYLYDATKPALVPGKRYGWRVQAKTKSGLEDLALFRNGGYSEVWVFTYQNTCPLPQGIGTTLQGQTAMIAWQANPVHLEYKVDYREKNNAAAEWFSLTNTIPSVLLADLKPSKEYEYRVGAACEYGILNYTDLLSFTTNSASVSNVPNCGDTSGIESSLPQTLLPALNPGDIIRTGDFDAVVTEATGGGGVFSGKGYIKVPWLLNRKIAVQFTNIKVNLDKKLTDGHIITTYDPTEKGLLNLGEFIQDIRTITEIVNDLKNLSIDRNAQDIREMIAAIKKMAEEELPQPLVDRINSVTAVMSQAKHDYDEAKNAYDNLPEGSAKEAAKAKMQEAESKFNLAKAEVEKINKEKDKLVRDVTNLVVQSIKELKGQSELQKPTAKAEWLSKKAEIATEVFTDAGLSATGDVLNIQDRGGLEEEIPAEALPIDLKAFADKTKLYNSKKKVLIVIQQMFALNNFYSDPYTANKEMATDSVLDGKMLIKKVMEKKSDGVSDAEIKVFIKDYLMKKINTIQ